MYVHTQMSGGDTGDLNKVSGLYQCQFPNLDIIHSYMNETVTQKNWVEGIVDLSVLFHTAMCELTIISK